MATVGRFEGQTALVTGGGSGIGRAVSVALGKAGARLLIADLNEMAADQTVAILSALGAQASTFHGDVSRSDQADAMVAAALERYGSLEVLVHSAGVGVERSFLETSDAEWNRIVGIDLGGSFYVMRAAGRVMAAAGYGRIVTLASTAGVRGGTGRAAYGAAKGGVIMLTKVLAVELAECGVTVNAIAPGAIETELVAAMHSDETRINYRRAIPANRYGTPEEVAHAALYLADKGASYVTGEVLAVDGGFLCAGVINRGQHS